MTIQLPKHVDISNTTSQSTTLNGNIDSTSVHRKEERRVTIITRLPSFDILYVEKVYVRLPISSHFSYAHVLKVIKIGTRSS